MAFSVGIQVVTFYPLLPASKLDFMTISLWLAAAASFFGHPLHASLIGLCFSTTQFLFYDFVYIRNNLARAAAEFDFAAGYNFTTSVARHSVDGSDISLAATALSFEHLIINYIVRGLLLLAMRFLVTAFSKLAQCSEAEKFAGLTRVAWAGRRARGGHNMSHAQQPVKSKTAGTWIQAAASLPKTVMVGLT